MRLSIEEYGCFLALIGKSRSEDFFTHCAAVAIAKDKRILGISYNGLAAGMSVPDWMKKEENREEKNKYHLHAESNLLAMLKKGECDTICLNISPCLACAKIIVSYDIKKVVYLKEYHRCIELKELFDFYGISHYPLPKEGREKIKQYLLNLNNFKELEDA